MSRSLQQVQRARRMKVCPDCGAPVMLAEASHFLVMPQEAMAPKQAPRPVAATYTCANGHEWTGSI